MDSAMFSAGEAIDGENRKWTAGEDFDLCLGRPSWESYYCCRVIQTC